MPEELPPEETPEAVVPPTFDEWYARYQKMFQLRGLPIPTEPVENDHNAYNDGLSPAERFQIIAG